MKKQLILSLALLVVLFSFAQKKELKSLEKAVKNSNYAEAKKLVGQLESMTSAMDSKSKAKYYLTKGKAFFANGAGSNEDVMMAVKSLGNIENATPEVTELKSLIENDLLVKANDFYKSEKFNEASQNFHNLYELVPEDQSYLYYAAASAVNVGEPGYTTALNYYTKLKDLGYTGIRTEYFAVNKATGEEERMPNVKQRDLFVKTGTYIKPTERKTKSVVADITKNIALIYMSQGENEKALAAFKDARENNPDDTSLLLSEANLHFKLGDKQKYSKLVEEAVKKDPNNVDLLYNLGVISAEAGDKAKAKEYYNKVIKLDPKYVNALTNMSALILSEEANIITEMNGLGSSASDDKRYDELKESRKDLYKSALPYLEKVLQIKEDENVAKTLMNIYSAVGFNEKFKAIKAKYKL